jgi:hypothetical protein
MAAGGQFRAPATDTLKYTTTSTLQILAASIDAGYLLQLKWYHMNLKNIVHYFSFSSRSIFHLYKRVR